MLTEKSEFNKNEMEFVICTNLHMYICWWRDAVSDAMTSSGHTGERAIHSSDFSAEKNPVGSMRSLAANAVSRSLFREQGLRE